MTQNKDEYSTFYTTTAPEHHEKTTPLSKDDGPSEKPNRSHHPYFHNESTRAQHRRMSLSVPNMGEYALGSGFVINRMRPIRRLERMSRSSRYLYSMAKELPMDEQQTLLPNKVSMPIDGEEDTNVIRYLFEMIFYKRISVLLLCLPPAYISAHYEWPPQYIFWLNFLGMIPLASTLGEFTEELALHTNQVIGGLINATFGNAVEVVVAVQALLANEIRVVQASMIGSVLSNLLLVLGSCFFFGGLTRQEQTFNSTAATANMSLLALSCIGMVLPTPFAEYYEVQDEDVLMISRIAALFMMFMYLQLLFFQLKTHADLFEDDDDDEKPNLPFWVALGGLGIVTVLVTIFSEYLIGSIDGYVAESRISKTFVGIVVLPIVGNAVEHITAVNVAMKDKMDLSMGVAIGSSTQVALFVVPFIIIVGWIVDKPMTLNFPHFEIILFVLSIVIVNIVLGNSKTNWLEGSLLITTYIMLAVGFWFENVVSFR